MANFIGRSLITGVPLKVRLPEERNISANGALQQRERAASQGVDIVKTARDHPEGATFREQFNKLLSGNKS